METIHIHTNSKDYPVILGAEAITVLAPFLKENFPSLSKVMIITDSHVGERYLSIIRNELGEVPHVVNIVPNGEAAKTFEVFYQCLSAGLEHKLDRKSVILAVGGGAIGDLSGFVASAYMRGIPYIQIPTTILAHDSAVGGKVAINHPLGKNMIGAFYQPDGVIYDLQFLKSLPSNEVRSGFAEVIKHALISDYGFYHWLSEEVRSLSTLSVTQLQQCLSKGIMVKKEIVSEDEKEQGIRAYLNFGHTLGHAIEAEMGYGQIRHGEAVAIGMVFALRLSNLLLNARLPLTEIVTWFNELGYQTTIPKDLKVSSLIERMKQDKKTVNQMVQFVLLKDYGKPELVAVDEFVIQEQLKLFMGEG